MKKFASLLLAVLMICTMIPFAAIPASAVEGVDKKDGEIHWKLDGDTLSIWGHGNMENYSGWKKTPWYKYDAYKKVKHLKVGIGEKDNITRIGSYAFAYFYYLESIDLGEGLEFIEDYAFFQAPYYTNVNLEIPSTVFYIGQYAFSEALGLKNVNIKSDYTALPDYVKKYSYPTVKGVNIPADGIYIEYKAFYKCYNINTLTIGNISKTNEKRLRIGDAAFENCNNLHTICFADSLDKIGYAGFCDCYSLKNIYYYGTKEKFKKVPITEKFNDYLLKVINGGHITYLGSYKYIDANGNQATLNSTKERCQILTQNITELNGGWYIVTEKLNLGGTRLKVTGNTNILLLDNCGIETSGGIAVYDTLNIYSQSLDKNKMGYINVTKAHDDCAGIGSDRGTEVDAAVNIYGGKITSKGASNSAGIGGGGYSKIVKITISAGIVTATGGDCGAGIGSGSEGRSITTISGGTVTAQGGKNGAGIGDGEIGYDQSIVNISAGNITATGGENGAGIGSGYKGKCTVNISGGNINAKGGKINESTYADAIGCGLDGTCNLTDTRKTGSVLSNGNLWIIVVVAVVALGGVAALVIVKKKKKPALAGGENTDE